MTTLRPLTDLAPDVLSSAVGTALRSVKYRLDLADFDRESGIHGTISAVQLGLDDGRELIVTWAMDRSAEGLWIGDDPQAVATVEQSLVEVTGDPEWRSRIGTPLTDVTVAVHRAFDADVDTIWAVGMKTASGDGVWVALGELEDSEPAYLPDEVVVLFGPERASAYRPPDAPTSAAGASLFA